jgi:DNA replication and repair protein RecF
VFIEEITFRNFRNYDSLDLHFSSNMNLVVGGNAQGKTNILEGIYFLSTAKSHRTSLDTELIQNGKSWFYLKGSVKARNSSTVVEMINASDEKKKIKIDGKSQSKISTIIGKINTVMFSPEDLSLVKGSPSERRRFLDILISRIDPTYLHNIQEYQSALRQRNELLKRLRERKAFKQSEGADSSADTLDSWDFLLVKSGSEVIRKRASVVPELSELGMDKHGQLTLSKEKLSIEYQSQLVKPDSNVDDLFQKKLKDNVDLDIRLGATGTGPHRDDLIFAIDDMDIRKFCSQGQQRTSVLSLKLATLELMNMRLDEYPIVLLDDVASELDDERVSLLFEMISKMPAQTFLTTTGLHDFRDSHLRRWLPKNTSGEQQAGLSIFIVENGIVRDGNAVYKGNS